MKYNLRINPSKCMYSYKHTRRVGTHAQFEKLKKIVCKIIQHRRQHYMRLNYKLSRSIRTHI